MTPRDDGGLDAEIFAFFSANAGFAVAVAEAYERETGNALSGLPPGTLLARAWRLLLRRPPQPAIDEELAGVADADLFSSVDRMADIYTRLSIEAGDIDPLDDLGRFGLIVFRRTFRYELGRARRAFGLSRRLLRRYARRVEPERFSRPSLTGCAAALHYRKRRAAARRVLVAERHRITALLAEVERDGAALGLAERGWSSDEVLGRMEAIVAEQTRDCREMAEALSTLSKEKGDALRLWAAWIALGVAIVAGVSGAFLNAITTATATRLAHPECFEGRSTLGVYLDLLRAREPEC